MKVFGIGWAKTGTTTLGVCLRELGFRHQSARLDLVDDFAEGNLHRILDVAGAHDSFEDWPWPLVFRELDEAFPAAKFVLTTREPRSWLASYRNMLASQGTASPALTRRRRILYGLPFPNVTDTQLLARVRRHEDEVKAWFRVRPDDLLVVDWASGDGWAALCSFLQRPVPDTPFPHANRASYGT